MLNMCHTHNQDVVLLQESMVVLVLYLSTATLYSLAANTASDSAPRAYHRHPMLIRQHSRRVAAS